MIRVQLLVVLCCAAMSDQGEQIIQVGLVEMEELPIVQEDDMKESDYLREYSVGGAAETLVMFGDPRPQIHPPENMAFPLDSTPQSSRLASPAPLEMDCLAVMMGEIKVINNGMQEGLVESKAMGDGSGHGMPKGQVESKAMGEDLRHDMKTMGDDVALELQAVQDEVNGVRRCVDGVWEEMKVGQVKMIDKINKIQR